jgi:hypothetical protein
MEKKNVEVTVSSTVGKHEVTHKIFGDLNIPKESKSIVLFAHGE